MSRRQPISINRRFIYALATVNLVIVMIFSLALLWMEIKRVEAHLEQLLDNAVSLAEMSLPSALWQFNDDSVGDFAKSLFLFREIVFIEVIAGDRTVLTRIRPGFERLSFHTLKFSPDFLIRQRAIFHEVRQVGLIRVAVSHDAVNDTVVRHAKFSLLLVVALTATMMLTVLLVTRRVLFRPLGILEKAVERAVDGEWHLAADALERDEIGRLSKAFATTLRRLRRITASRDELDQEIRKRQMAMDLLAASEQRYRSLFDNMSSGVAVYRFPADRQEFIFIDCNFAAERITGLKRRQMVERNVRDLFPGMVEMGLLEVFRQVAASGQPQRHSQGFYTDNRLTFWADNFVYLLPSGELVAVFDDITERKKTEMALKKANDALERRVRERTEQLHLSRERAMRSSHLATIGVLSASIAHDINTPNDVILLNAPILDRTWQRITPLLTGEPGRRPDLETGSQPTTELVERGPQLIGTIIQSAKRIERIIHHLKHLVRQDSGEMNDRIDMREIIQESTALLRNKIQKHTDAFRLAVSETPPIIRGNAQQLEQVVVNLTLNALESLPDRSRGVLLTLQRDPLNDRLLFEVHDEGHGIPAELLPAVFEALFTTKAESGGTGLGLVTCKRIIERHRGTLIIDSEVDKGTSVTVSLPVGENADGSAQATLKKESNSGNRAA